MIKVLILDFDGVIVESVDIKNEAFKELYQEYDNVDDIVQYHLQNNAISRCIKFKYICNNFLGGGYNEEIETELDNRFSEIVFQKIVQCPFVVGVEEFLQVFSKIYPIYVVSASPQEELKRIITERNIQGYFSGIWGVPNIKVDAIRVILENEKASPSEAIYVGDMVEDFKVAQKAGVVFVGRKNKESFDGLNIPEFHDFSGIKGWVQGKRGSNAI